MNRHNAKSVRMLDDVIDDAAGCHCTVVLCIIHIATQFKLRLHLQIPLLSISILQRVLCTRLLLHKTAMSVPATR
jgi:hypothetical protein